MSTAQERYERKVGRRLIVLAATKNIEGLTSAARSDQLLISVENLTAPVHNVPCLIALEKIES